jgi:hypothetical protein
VAKALLVFIVEDLDRCEPKKRSKILLSLFALQVLLYGSLSTASALSCEGLFQNIGGASVEIEMSMSGPVLNLLTTTNGMVGGLIKTGKLSKDYLTWAEMFYPEKDPRQIEWDLLDDQIKLILLKQVSRDKTTNFFEDRSVPNVKVKDIIHVKFDTETVFLGQKYAAGEHDIDLSAFFGRVEYMSPTSVKNFSGVELHLRSADLEAGHLIESAWALQTGIGTSKTHFHEHIVNPLPMKALESKPVETSLVLTEYYRRLNLLAEFVTVLKRQGIYASTAFSFKSLSTISYFDSITPHFLSGIFNYFVKGVPQGKKIADKFKMGWVGFRGSDVYDQPNLYGFEYRAIDSNDSLPLHKKILNNVQDGMRTEHYGFSENLMTGWAHEKGIALDNPAQVEKALEALWYKQSYRTLFKRMPDYLKPGLGGPVGRLLLVLGMKSTQNGNQAVKMLLYDWAADPLFSSDPTGQRKLIEAQKMALQRYFWKGEPLYLITRDFVLNSGLLEKVAHTFGLEKDDFAELVKPPAKAE